MNILFLLPRLDVPFKESYVPEERGEIPPIRKNWLDFAISFKEGVTKRNVTVTFEEKPLWKFNPSDYVNSPYDTIMVPHREKHNFHIPEKNVYYYMQSVIPSYFSIDTNGWAGNLSYIPFKKTFSSHPHWNFLKQRIKSNISKFSQPTKTWNEDDYILFICQIPHDQTIKYHSDISVESALEKTILACKETGKKLVVKGHPVNPSAMIPLHDILIRHDYGIWIEDISIHDAIKNSIACVTVNSGSGLEVILHEKPLYAFGSAEYSELVSQSSLKEWLDSPMEIDILAYRDFVEAYMESLYDSTEPKSFGKFLSDK